MLRRREASEGRNLAFPDAPEPLPHPIIDNHTHLEFEDGVETLLPAESLARASAVGVRGVVQVGTDLETSRWSAEIAANDPRVKAAVALHPNEAPRLSERGELEDQLAAIDELAAKEQVCAVGETGLDFFRTPPQLQHAQFEAFEAHIDIAKRHRLVLQIHDRDAHQEVLDTLRSQGAPEATVLHCFSGDRQFAKQFLDAGCYLSFAGTVTFKSAQALREALLYAPADRILVETDAPFLTPEPFRGRPNAPYLLPNTVRRIAAIREVELEVLCQQLEANTERIYGRWPS